MFGKKLRWYRIFNDEFELLEAFIGRNSVLHKSMFGEVLLVQTEGNYYAFKNKCPHQGKSLEGCSINGGNIVCPYHRYAFSLDDGRGHGLYVDKYEFRIDETGVYVGKMVWTLF